jgi:hypothetical protein
MDGDSKKSKIDELIDVQSGLATLPSFRDSTATHATTISSAAALDLPNDILGHISQRTSTLQTPFGCPKRGTGCQPRVQTHTKSTVRTVIQNVVGLAPPEALRIVRHAERGDADADGDMIREEYKCLWANAAVVMIKQLEAVFGSRYAA